MPCKRCKRARYAVQIWFYEVTGLRGIHDRLWAVIRQDRNAFCTSSNQMESNHTVLARQVRAANRTLQSDYVKLGNAIDILERRIQDLEAPGIRVLTIIEPHKSN